LTSERRDTSAWLRIVWRAPPTHAFSGLVGVCLAERALIP